MQPLKKPDPIAEVAELLGNYVYLLVDPRDGKPFYVGKGRGDRAQAHEIAALAERLETPSDPTSDAGTTDEVSAKTARIRSIHFSGYTPEVWIARYGLSESEYTAVEAALIDLLLSFEVREASTPNPLQGTSSYLTNQRREAARGHGVVKLQTLIDDYRAPDLATEEPLVLIKLTAWNDKVEAIPGGGTRDGYGFRHEWLDRSRIDHEELGRSTCCWWVLNPDSTAKRRIPHAVALYRGVTRGLFEIDASSWETKKGEPTRRGFVGTPVTSGPLWDDVVGPHGRRVSGLTQGDRYWPLTRQRTEAVSPE
ncbi:hypothetical protein [Rhodococcus sp. IEGM 1408]|uniref:hypothetical protein n=1 Tax=Rhodococcus sp. IEGM 1408 TaxID=3082220 RepID=UPI002952C79A|nr:hypothetical protein [Rhodococcus sp. IEGM 1408]MDV8003073.1 hypothetical protein [Rhodococcus sp. IEGM 1408]